MRSYAIEGKFIVAHYQNLSNRKFFKVVRSRFEKWVSVVQKKSEKQTFEISIWVKNLQFFSSKNSRLRQSL